MILNRFYNFTHQVFFTKLFKSFYLSFSFISYVDLQGEILFGKRIEKQNIHKGILMYNIEVEGQKIVFLLLLLINRDINI